ncbi:hypothetical protein PAXRUDRAFT_25378 [Paxillus rubicundulus Ve08.2h10]|uniref:Uncharacterized protein n=1 Tax=Paxillus rubicundulus Ve08.2h10 TaxID=930991 RepID=A0A0D0DZ83_9AGAM|nr:hypothetical protein PAXRUDRAFT_25378 [Paxillus rubicundulus Ve08.2h10]
MSMGVDQDPGADEYTQARADFTDSSKRLYCTYHQFLNGRPCSADGEFLPAGAPPPPPKEKAPDDWTPYRNRVEFELAELLFTRIQMSNSHMDALLNLWAATLAKHGDRPPFASHNDLHGVIDSTPLGGVKWQGFAVKYKGEQPETDVPSWMDGQYEVWFRDAREVVHNMLSRPDFASEMDHTPF